MINLLTSNYVASSIDAVLLVLINSIKVILANIASYRLCILNIVLLEKYMTVLAVCSVGAQESVL